jgi:hypothetical protein
MTNIETWKICTSNPNYEISDFGQVRSLRHNLIINARTYGGTYLRVNLWLNGVPTRRSVHSLVLETFIGPRPPGMITRHYPDQNPTNNHLNNLSYATGTQNAYDRLENNTYHQAKLTETEVIEIKEALMQGVSGSILVKTYGISAPVITNIKHNKIWKNVGPDISSYFKKYGKQLSSNIELIFKLKATGWRNDQIGELLNLNESTIYNTIRGKYNK